MEFHDMFNQFMGGDIPDEEDANRKMEEHQGMILRMAKFVKYGLIPYFKEIDESVELVANEVAVVSVFYVTPDNEVFMERQVQALDDVVPGKETLYVSRVVYELNLTQFLNDVIETDGDIKAVVMRHSGRSLPGERTV